MTDARRALPAVSTLLATPGIRELIEHSPRALVTDAIRAAVERVRQSPSLAPDDNGGWDTLVRQELELRERASLRPVFNATGVILHTNLGRAPLARVAIEAIARTAAGASNLEYDVDSGERGSRYVHCAALLREVTGAEDAVVVNNGAAALVLALNTLAEGRESIVSRGELIEIGGSFRVPEIMSKSGSTLREVGTTNRTHPDDYRRAITNRTGAIVKVHRSNFELRGFVAEASLRDLATLAQEAAVPVIMDLGSGLLVPLDDHGLGGEPTAADAIRDGASLVVMSGDKLLGGPQAGIIAGARQAVDACRKNPLTRALRVDKLTLAALEATLALYRDPPRALREIPVLAMLTVSADSVRTRAVRIATRFNNAQVVETEAAVGGGAFPGARLRSFGVALEGDAQHVERRLRTAAEPVIGRIVQGRFLLDLRSLPEDQDEALVSTVMRALS